MAPRDALTYPESDQAFLEPYLPSQNEDPKPSSQSLPFTTLTFATSLDSSLALSPGVRTALSGPQSKSMTHYLRSRHDAILIGVGTAIADNPGLNCRIGGVGGYGREGLTGQPRPIVIDPTARWDITADSKILALVRSNQGLAPFIITGTHCPPPAPEKQALLERHGGRYLALDVDVDVPRHDTDKPTHRIDWTALLRCLREQGLRSVMIEGGGSIINSLLEPQTQHLVDSVVVTIAPTWLGRGGVVVSPDRRVDGQGVAIPASRLTQVKWYPLGRMWCSVGGLRASRTCASGT